MAKEHTHQIVNAAPGSKKKRVICSIGGCKDQRVRQAELDRGASEDRSKKPKRRN